MSASTGAGFTDRVAIVTGGASGIGRSLVHALHRRGARVVVADVNGEGADAVVRELGGTRATAARVNVTAARVDVTDPDQVQRLVDETVAREGRIDLMFNNAGIALFADTRDTALADWNRIIDVNLRGVVHGVAAAYPVMVRQRSGHIVNTASVAGLVPTPAMIAYVASKHAVVGLTLTLRAEAALHGVRATVVCPGLIETPIVQSTKIVGPSRERLLAEMPFKLHSPDRLAEAVLRGIERNQAIVPFTSAGRVSWWLHRLSPRASLAMSAWFYRRSPFVN